jgi:hypothetical protein
MASSSNSISEFIDDEIPAFDDKENFDTSIAPSLDNFQDYYQEDEEMPTENYQHLSPILPSPSTMNQSTRENETLPFKKLGNKKRQKIVLNEKVELNNKVIKQNLIDRGAIMRRFPGEILNGNNPQELNFRMDDRLTNPNSKGSFFKCASIASRYLLTTLATYSGLLRRPSILNETTPASIKSGTRSIAAKSFGDSK